MIKDNPYQDEPMSRFWACVFSMSIFALFWTQKMRRTRDWILIFALILFTSGISRVLSTAGSYSNTATLESMIIAQLVFSVISFGPIVLAIYVMYGWTTEYNKKVFGYESKKEWKKSKSSIN